VRRWATDLDGSKPDLIRVDPSKSAAHLREVNFLYALSQARSRRRLNHNSNIAVAPPETSIMLS
jgi:hypothetical protein